MMIEFLYPELGNLYGEHGTQLLLRRIFTDAEFVSTQLAERPRFADTPVDILYLGPSSERGQEQILERLRPLAERLRQRIDEGCFVLFIGNALELLGEYIETDKGRRIPCLGLYPFHARQDFTKRLNSEYLGEAQGQWRHEHEILGFKTQFSSCFDANSGQAFAQNRRGIGLNRSVNFEGICERNLIATYLVGPFLIMNPHFTRLWLDKMGQKDREIPFFDDMVKAYDVRKKEFLNPKTYLE